MREIENRCRAEGFRAIAGVDEAGRGPLAGPVVAAAVVIELPFFYDEQSMMGIRDSKQLSAAQRASVFFRLSEIEGIHAAIGSASVEEIDRLNILQATYLAMRRAVDGLEERPDCLLIDGRPVPGMPVHAEFIVKGDARSLSIAAASIVAKVTRDKWMTELDEQYPGYGFSRHKGYGTRAHREALQRLGPCAIHRQSFAPVQRLMLEV